MRIYPKNDENSVYIGVIRSDLHFRRTLVAALMGMDKRETKLEARTHVKKLLSVRGQVV